MRKFIRENYTVLLLATLVSLVLHWRIFHLDLMGQHVWRQTQTQLNIRNFTLENMNIFDPRISQIDYGTSVHRMEFPLMQWCIALVDRAFGYSVFITRLMMFIIGILCMAGAGFFARHFFSDRKAVPVITWTFTFSPLFYYYTLNPLPDVAAIGCILWGCGYFFSWRNTQRDRDLVFAGIFLSLGALIKLPFILYSALIFFAAFFRRKEGAKRVAGILMKGMCWLIIPLAWYIYVIPQWVNNPVTTGVLGADQKQVHSMLDYLWGNFSSSLPELLINYASVPLFIAGWWFIFRNRNFRSEKFLLACIVSLLILVYFLFELNLIAVVHDYYLFPFIPVIFLLVTYGAVKWWDTGKGKFVVLTLLVLCPFAAYLRMDNRWDMNKPGFNRDLLLHASQIQRLIPADDSIITVGDQSFSIWFYYLDKKGWGYMSPVNTDYIRDRINDGAKYVVTDSRGVVDSLIRDTAQIHVHSVSTIASFHVLDVRK